MRKSIGEKRKAIKAALSAFHSLSGQSAPVVEADGRKTRRLIRRVTVETERTFIFRTRSEHHSGWCRECGAEVEMASVQAAAREGGFSELAIFQLIESGALHFKEDAEGQVFICLNSLTQRLTERV